MRYPPYRAMAKKPPVFAQLDYNHELCRGLLFYLIPGAPAFPLFEAVSGAAQPQAANNGVVFAGSPWGPALWFDGQTAGAEVRFTRAGKYPADASNAFSCMAGVSCALGADITTNHYVMSIGETTDSNFRWSFGITNTNPPLVSIVDANVAAFNSPGIALPADGSFHVIGGSQRSLTSRTLCLDGLLGVNTGTIQTGAIGVTQPWVVGNAYSNSVSDGRTWAGAISWVALWNRALVDGEMVSICQNPFQMFYS